MTGQLTEFFTLQPAINIAVVPLFLPFISPQRLCKVLVTVLKISKYQVADSEWRRDVIISLGLWEKYITCLAGNSD